MTTFRKLPTDRPIQMRNTRTGHPWLRRWVANTRGASEASVAAADDPTQLEDRQVHGNDQTTDEHAENRHDHRLHQRGQVVDRVVDLLFVVRGRLVEHGIERAGLFTDG